MTKQQILDQIAAMLRHRPHDPGQAWIQLLETMRVMAERLPDDPDRGTPAGSDGVAPPAE